MYLNINKRKFITFFFLFLIFNSIYANASVIITGTRVIYHSDEHSKTIQLRNNDKFPNVIQSWIDVGDEESMPDSSKAPFLVNPPVFRMEPESGHNIRIIFTGDKTLPQDRESLFHLNVLQIPPRNTNNSDRNQILLMLKNRLKLFYRPHGISGSPAEISKHLSFKLINSGNQWHIEVDNPTGYHASFGSAAIEIKDSHIPLKHNMVEPYKKSKWKSDEIIPLPEGQLYIHIQLINDYGARIEQRQLIKR